jgi:hypothetical protein
MFKLSYALIGVMVIHLSIFSAPNQNVLDTSYSLWSDPDFPADLVDPIKGEFDKFGYTYLGAYLLEYQQSQSMVGKLYALSKMGQWALDEVQRCVGALTRTGYSSAACQALWDNFRNKYDFGQHSTTLKLFGETEIDGTRYYIVENPPGDRSLFTKMTKTPPNRLQYIFLGTNRQKTTMTDEVGRKLPASIFRTAGVIAFNKKNGPFDPVNFHTEIYTFDESYYDINKPNLTKYVKQLKSFYRPIFPKIDIIDNP